MSFNVAIDGPAGAGKSTIAKKIAKKQGFIYIDTGAMYRAMAVYFLDNGVVGEDGFSRACQEADISIAYADGEQQVILNGENVTKRLRNEEVGKMASMSSSCPSVRTKLVELQQILASKTDVVMDGRDIGTVVLPKADVKIYLTASAKTRAKRRFLELTEKGIPCKIEEIESDIIERDKRDMERTVSPLRQAEDALWLDSSDLTIEEVVDIINQLIDEKRQQ